MHGWWESGVVTVRNSMEIAPKRSKMQLLIPCDPVILLMGIYLREQMHN